MRGKRDFNHIKEWLLPLIQERDYSVEKLARSVGITRASLYYYLADRTRPTTGVMRRICDVLGRPHEEGLATYTEKPVGRPKGT